MTDRKSWDSYFMSLAEESAKRSKDPVTKVGSCIVKDKRVLSLGYNGAPRAFPDKLVPSENGDSIIKQKNTFMCHSELNSILNYRGSLSDFEGATIYVTVSPCYDCAKALAQVGIKEVIYKKPYHRDDIWRVSQFILRKCGIKFRRFIDDN